MPFVGDHEMEVKCNGTNVPFKSFLSRYPTPYKDSDSTNQLYYSWNYGGTALSFLMTCVKTNQSPWAKSLLILDGGNLDEHKFCDTYSESKHSVVSFLYISSSVHIIGDSIILE